MNLLSLACGSALHGLPSPEHRSRSTFGRSPLRESRTPGSARGAVRNHRPYRDISLDRAGYRDRRAVN
jgi:hypothetical protein